MTQTDVSTAVQRQFMEEYGNQMLPDHKYNHRFAGNHRAFDPSCAACRAGEEANALRQKFGISSPQLFQGRMRKKDGSVINVDERRVISREERMRNGGHR